MTLKIEIIVNINEQHMFTNTFQDDEMVAGFNGKILVLRAMLADLARADIRATIGFR